MAAPKKTSGKAAADKPKAKRTAQGGLAKPVTPDATLASIVGSAPLTRAALTQKILRAEDPMKIRELLDRLNASLKAIQRIAFFRS